MCQMPSLNQLGIGAAVGGQVYSGMTARSNAKAQAQIASDNERVMLATAGLESTRRELIAARTALDESRVRGRVAETAGAIEASFAARNVDATTGSPLAMAAAALAQGEVDVGLLRAQGLIDEGESFGREASIRQGAAGQNFAAAGFRARADDAMIASYFGAGTAFLNAQTRWAALNPASGNPDRTRYSLAKPGGSAAWSVYG